MVWASVVRRPFEAILAASGMIAGALGFVQSGLQFWEDGPKGWQLQLAGYLLFTLAFVLLIARWEAERAPATTAPNWLGRLGKYLESLQKPKASSADQGALEEGLRGVATLTPTPLTTDQIAFRAALKHFALNVGPEIAGRLSHVFDMVMRTERDKFAHEPHSVALHMFATIYTRSNNHLATMCDFAQPPLEQMDVVELQQAIIRFLGDYHLRQKFIGTINHANKSALTGNFVFDDWLARDRDAKAEYDKLRIWPEAQLLKPRQADEFFGSGNAQAWAKQHRIGYD